MGGQESELCNYTYKVVLRNDINNRNCDDFPDGDLEPGPNPE